MNWQHSDIASAVSVLESGSRPKGGATVESGEIPSLGGENILKHGGVTLEEVKRVPRKFFERMTKGHLKNADVLINKDGAQTGKVGFYKNNNGADACINEHLFLIRGDANKISQSYLYYSLLSQACQNQIEAQISGSAQPGLKSDFLKGVFARIPEALPEQSKIAEVLSKVDQAIEQTEYLIAKQQRIKTGLMQDLLTRGIDEQGNLRSEETHEFKDSPLGRIPVEWVCSLLSYFVPSAEYGISTSLGDFGTPVLRMNNFSEGEADVSDLKYTELMPPEKLWLRDGDVLFNRTNSWEHVGRTGIWRCQIEKATFASYLVRLNPDPDKLLSELLNIWLNWEPTQIAMRRMATPAVQQVNINPTNLRSIYAAFPTCLSEQGEIGKRLACLRKTISTNVEGLAKLRSLKTALMQDLLTGKKRVTPLMENMEVCL